MSSPFIGEIRMFAGNFAPAGWAFCEGQLLSTTDFAELFNVIGTIYGGDGVNNYALPDLRGRVPLHLGSLFGHNFVLAESDGVETVTLTVNQIAPHVHSLQATTNNADSNSANNNLLAQPPIMLEYFGTAPSAPLAATAVGSTGGGQPHTNLQRYLCINFIIALFGIVPQ